MAKKSSKRKSDASCAVAPAVKKLKLESNTTINNNAEEAEPGLIEDLIYLDELETTTSTLR